ncbi:Putative ribosomal N-acetyltransferase YdaF [Cedecea neteri]|uniref:N-acetyltransferase n=1 Tax=Cedecea neteri TaxID=158822 RepID=A0A291E3C0_9ENTR|nr:GNAT family N-acetyltransferase [Cedecea neteri]ATF94537.1 N-acetyltransferase [Cedecea neteri]SQA97985.1 Putative ribosomal N-acetyltransferase YdaF [Cedecea neteri]
MQLESKRLILRPFTLNDTHILCQLANDPWLAKWTQSFSEPFTLKRAEQWLRKTITETEQLMNITLSVRLKNDGALIGAVSVKFPEVDNAEIGYWLGSAHHGKGYCVEAVREVIRFAFSEYNLSRISGHCDCNNQASAQVMIRSGMRLSEQPHPPVIINGKNVSLYTYEVFRQL